jgi:serine/threonine protein kinase
MPTFISYDAQNLLRALFKRNPLNRLGSGSNEAQEVKQHSFFSTICWNKLLCKQISPPFKPSFNNLDETHYFDMEFTKRIPKVLNINFSSVK